MRYEMGRRHGEVICGKGGTIGQNEARREKCGYV